MQANETSGQEPGDRTDLEITVCSNGVVNILRPESDRAHSVFVSEDGDVLRCSCKGHYYRGHCSHQEAIESRPLVTASARAAAATGQQVATDGGRVESDENGDLPEIEDVGEHRCRCTGCERTGVKDLDREPVILHKKGCPHADEQEAEDDCCDECGRRTELPDDHDERELHTADCPNLGSTVDPYADENEEVDTTPL